MISYLSHPVLPWRWRPRVSLQFWSCPSSWCSFSPDILLISFAARSSSHDPRTSDSRIRELEHVCHIRVRGVCIGRKARRTLSLGLRLNPRTISSWSGTCCLNPTLLHTCSEYDPVSRNRWCKLLNTAVFGWRRLETDACVFEYVGCVVVLNTCN
jgi:hypothetical protein